MATIPVSELQESLNEYLARVRGGEEVVLTDQGVPVAKIVPVPHQGDYQATYERLVRTGVLRPPEKSLPKDFFEKLPRVSDPEGKVLQFLLDERESGW
jgi:prevent-host-death family protein